MGIKDYVEKKKRDFAEYKEKRELNRVSSQAKEQARLEKRARLAEVERKQLSSIKESRAKIDKTERLRSEVRSRPGSGGGGFSLGVAPSKGGDLFGGSLGGGGSKGGGDMFAGMYGPAKTTPTTKKRKKSKRKVWVPSKKGHYKTVKRKKRRR